MATITLEYNPRTKGAIKLISSIKESGYFQISTPKKGKTAFEESLEDIEKGRIFEATDAKDLIAQCLKNV